MTIQVAGFETRYDTKTEGVDWVKIGPKGLDFQNTQTWHRVESLRPKADPTRSDSRQADTLALMEARWSVIEPAYLSWKGGQELPETGTPLAAWNGVSPSAADHLRRMGILSVEDVAAMSPDEAARLAFPNSRELPKLAARYLDSESATAQAAKMETMEATIAELQAMLDAKPKRGRPPKNAAPEAEEAA